MVRDYADDEKNTETVTTLRLHVGGGSRALGVGSGIHWHMDLDNRIDYVARRPRAGDSLRAPDYSAGRGGASTSRKARRAVRLRERRAAAWTAWTATTGQPTPSSIPLSVRLTLPSHRAASRASFHSFGVSPWRRFANLPERATALRSIESRLTRFYGSRGETNAALIRRAVAATQEAWATNVFPAMRVTWGTYPNHIGHVDTPGCFRCHDDSHKTDRRQSDSAGLRAVPLRSGIEIPQ